MESIVENDLGIETCSDMNILVSCCSSVMLKEILLKILLNKLYWSMSSSSQYAFISVPVHRHSEFSISVCEDTNTPKSYRFHPGLWSGKRWSCCKSIGRTTFGCQAATHWRETNNNPTFQ
uniref:Uncharacterized protein n=1 Tax=Glossina brevipalpis TaxID=37001 RepID=A0A1A9WWB7_9MUSC